MGLMKNLIKKILRESDDFDWIRDVDPIVNFDQLVVGESYVVNDVNGQLMLNSLYQCEAEWPDELDYDAGPDEVARFFKGEEVFVKHITFRSKDMSDCINDNEKALQAHLDFVDIPYFVYWCYEDMVKLTIK
jgi:hypothetical protein